MDSPALEKIANRLRFLILTMTHAVGAGHPTTCFSAVELMSVLFFRHLKADLDHPDNSANDRIVFSKGHASALLYALYAIAGKVTEEELKTYRKFPSVLEGHPTIRFTFAEAATGSLGQGLSIAAGIAEGIKLRLKAQKTDVLFPKVYCLMGDGELAEGSVWEAVSWAGHRKTPNLVAIVDANGLGQSAPTMEKGDAQLIARRFEAFGWASIVIDGHSLSEIDAAYSKARTYTTGPVAIIARTIKGKGISMWEGKDGWHNKLLPKDDLEKALSEYGKDENKITGVVGKPEIVVSLQQDAGNQPALAQTYSDPVPTKKAFGNAIESLVTAMPDMIVLDGDVANSLHLDTIAKTIPDRFFQIYIAEQNMAGVATGLSRMGFHPVINTFAAFLTRAHDQIRMMSLSGTTVLINGSYVGVSVGRDGPSQMGLEDLALIRSINGSTVVYPSDPYQTEYLTRQLIHVCGISYIRTTREATPVIYSAKDTFAIGGSHTFPASGAKEMGTVVAAGITLHEALKAQSILAREGIFIRVIDCYSIKPIDSKTLRDAAIQTGKIVVVEDHYPQGGLGDAVRSALESVPVRFTHLSVNTLPQSGSPDELLAMEGIDSAAIVSCIKDNQTGS